MDKEGNIDEKYSLLFVAGPTFGSYLGYRFTSRFVHLRKTYDFTNFSKEQKLLIINNSKYFLFCILFG